MLYTCKGQPYLGVALGVQEYTRQFMDDKVRKWSAEVLLLAKISESQPCLNTWSVQSVALCISYCTKYCCTCIFATFGGCDLLHSSSYCVRNIISPSNDAVCNLVGSPPCWVGSLGVFRSTVQCVLDYSVSVDITGNYIVSGQSID